MSDTQPRIAFAQSADGLHARPLGLWTAESLAGPKHWDALHAALGTLPKAWRSWQWDWRTDRSL